MNAAVTAEALSAGGIHAQTAPLSRCAATTKAGEPCPKAPMTGREMCLAHADEETRRAAGFVPEAGAAGRPPKPRSIDVWREKVEGEIEIWMKPFRDALDATDMLGGPDHKIRVRAAESVLDRVYGKPTQRSEVSGPDGAALPAWLLLVAPSAQASDGAEPSSSLSGS